MRKELETLAKKMRQAMAASGSEGVAPVVEEAPEPAPAPLASKGKSLPPQASKPAAAPKTVTPPPGTKQVLQPGVTPSGRYIVKIVVAPKVRCDILAYAGLHCGGQMHLVRVLPHGGFEGNIDGNEFQSLFLAGPHGTRVTIATGTGDDWEKLAWRSVKLVPGKTFTARNGKPSVRVPDLDTIDRPDARRAETESQESYPFAETREQGEGWTYGRPGHLKNRVRVLYVDKE